ncbi:tetratricopeptide repeat protein [Nonlabens sp.]|uniref:tetratricopeptide repeat protein n=1 Tax=Nonlabens sp. TaxID=1888209 RepID=UPI003F6983C1
MKIRLTILFLAITALGFAQKREMKKIEKAVEVGDIPKAMEIFKSINESDLEEKYKGQYSFYKAAYLIDVTGAQKPSLEDAYSAREEFNKAMDLGYKNPILTEQVSNYINQSFLQIANEKLVEDPGIALDIVKTLVKDSPEDMAMLYSLAVLSYQTGNFDIAKDSFQKLLDKGYTGQKTTFIAVNKETNQEEVFPSETLRNVSIQTGSHLKPTQSKTPSLLGMVVSNLVWLQKESGNLEKAKETYNGAISKYPNDMSLIAAKADIFLTLGMMDDYEKAVRSLSEDIDDPKVLNNLAQAAIDKKEYDKAIRYYKSSIELDPNNFVSKANLGLAYIEKGNAKEITYDEQQSFYNKATESYEGAHELKPENKPIINTLISLYGALNMDEKLAAMKAKL